MPRPRVVQSTQAAACGQRAALALQRVHEQSSRSRARRVSATSQGDSMRSSATSTSSTWPVRPMPPCVARNSSGSFSSVISSTRPSATRMRSARTCAAEGARLVVVLAVHVRRHHAAERHVGRAGEDRAREAARPEDPVDLPEREPGLGAQDAGLGVEGEEAVRAPRTHHAVARGGGQRGVAVGAAETARELRAGAGGLEVHGRLLAALQNGQPTPARELRRPGIHRKQTSYPGGSRGPPAYRIDARSIASSRGRCRPRAEDYAAGRAVPDRGHRLPARQLPRRRARAVPDARRRRRSARPSEPRPRGGRRAGFRRRAVRRDVDHGRLSLRLRATAGRRTEREARGRVAVRHAEPDAGEGHRAGPDLRSSARAPLRLPHRARPALRSAVSLRLRPARACVAPGRSLERPCAASVRRAR